MNTAEYLSTKYNSLHLNSEQLAEVLHYRNSKALLNAISAETCPVPTFKLGAKRVADVRDVAKYLDELRTTAQQHAACL